MSRRLGVGPHLYDGPVAVRRKNFSARTHGRGEELLFARAELSALFVKVSGGSDGEVRLRADLVDC